MCSVCNARLRRTPRVHSSTASERRGLIRLQGREEEGKGKEGGAALSVSKGGRRKGRGKEGGRRKGRICVR
uniref:Uncharacterized protein n=1 Tax=Oryza meridionalis TaxID=40149 RepID=A0A0E0CQS0_9ORYZ